MGESSDTPLKRQYDRRVRLDFRGATITSDAGLLACRELERQSVYSRLAGYEDTNDAERLAQDPAMRVIVGWQGTEKQAASTNTMSRFETEVLTEEENLDGLARLNVEWVDRAMAQTSHQRVILDMDNSESPVRGQQEGVAYNGHFESVCYHRLFLFNHFGDCEGAMLCPGNVHSAERWREVLEPVVKRYQEKGVRLLLRADAAFAKPAVYEYLESRDTGYAMRLPANEVLQGNIRHLLKRPVGRPPKKPVVRYHDFVYQAQSWDIPRRVVAKVEWHHLNLTSAGVTHYYNGRGTAEQWIKEGRYALNWTRLSCHRFVANQVRLWLFVLAYNLGNFMRRLTLPESVKHWSLRSVQTKLIKMGGRLVRPARRLVFQLAEVAVSLAVSTPDGSPARRAVSHCICHSAGLGKPSSIVPWPDSAPCHSLPDGGGGNRPPLTHQPTERPRELAPVRSASASCCVLSPLSRPDHHSQTVTKSPRGN